jgi:hypothetical protein
MVTTQRHFAERTFTAAEEARLCQEWLQRVVRWSLPLAPLKALTQSRSKVTSRHEPTDLAA